MSSNLRIVPLVPVNGVQAVEFRHPALVCLVKELKATFPTGIAQVLQYVADTADSMHVEAVLTADRIDFRTVGSHNPVQILNLLDGNRLKHVDARDNGIDLRRAQRILGIGEGAPNGHPAPRRNEHKRPSPRGLTEPRNYEKDVRAPRRERMAKGGSY